MSRSHTPRLSAGPSVADINRMPVEETYETTPEVGRKEARLLGPRARLLGPRATSLEGTRARTA